MITFDIVNHGPFHVSTGVADEGVDSPIDLACPLPATALKGLMRAEAVNRLEVKDALVAAIFGRSTVGDNGEAQRSAPGAWQWGDATFAEVTPAAYARIAVDERGLTRPGFLAFGTQAWATGGTFTVEPRVRLDDNTITQHILVLRACARSVSSLGGDRRRGSGWVTISDEQEWTIDDTRSLKDLLGGVR